MVRALQEELMEQSVPCLLIQFCCHFQATLCCQLVNTVWFLKGNCWGFQDPSRQSCKGSVDPVLSREVGRDDLVQFLPAWMILWVAVYTIRDVCLVLWRFSVTSLKLLFCDIVYLKRKLMYSSRYTERGKIHSLLLSDQNSN